jgi:hypothetical protein
VIYVNVAVEEEILHGGPMTSVINISRKSRINWPGNSVYLYHGLCWRGENREGEGKMKEGGGGRERESERKEKGEGEEGRGQG